MTRVSPDQLGTRLVGDSALHVVNAHLSYRVDEVVFSDGHTGTYTYVDDEHPAVVAVPLAKFDGKTHVLMIDQECYPSQSKGWEVPAGGIHVEERTDGTKRIETPLGAARREAFEEAGVIAERWQHLPTPIIENTRRGNSRFELFVATGITVVRSMVQADEVITRRGWFDFDQVDEMIGAGEIDTAHTLASILKVQAFLRRNPDHLINEGVV